MLASLVTPLPSVMVGKQPSDTRWHSTRTLIIPVCHRWASVDRDIKDRHSHNTHMHKPTHTYTYIERYLLLMWVLALSHTQRFRLNNNTNLKFSISHTNTQKEIHANISCLLWGQCGVWGAWHFVATFMTKVMGSSTTWLKLACDARCIFSTTHTHSLGKCGPVKEVALES